VLEFCFLTGFFWGRYKGKFPNLLFLGSVIICVSIGFISLFTFGIIEVFLTQWLSVNNLAFTMWTLLLVYEYYLEDLSHFKEHPSLPFFLSGLFLYNCSTVFVFPLWEYVTNPNSPLSVLIPIHAVFNSIMYLLITIGFYLEIRPYILKKRHE
jgi:hypothetical protein